MEVNGRVPSGPNVTTLVLPREGQEPFVFRARAVLDYSHFEKVCPKPQPPNIQRRGESGWTPDVMDKDYLKALAERNGYRFAFMFLESLKATDGLKWDMVDMNDPKTYDLAEQELLKAGFNMYEIDMLVTLVKQANSLDDAMLEAARARFFAKQSLEQAQSL